MTKRIISYELWDVFTDRRFSGNPLAVVPDAEGLTDDEMQTIAREFNLSETAFVLPSQVADVRARYFTPAQELPMAGHPSIGTVYSLHHNGRVSGEAVTLELQIGIVAMRLEEKKGLTRVWMNQGQPQRLETFSDRAQVAAALGLQEADLDRDLPLEIWSAGVPFLYVPVGSLEALAKASVTQESLTRLMDDDHKAVFVFTRNTDGSDVRARMLGLALGIVEDPATGSAHGPLGAYLATHGVLSFKGDTARLLSYQGVEMGRPSEISVQVVRDGEKFTVHVGGASVMVGEGKLYI